MSTSASRRHEKRDIPNVRAGARASEPPSRRLTPFVLIVTLILVSGYAYVGSQLLLGLELPIAALALLWLALLLPIGMMAWLPFVYWQLEQPEPRHDRWVWAAFVSMALLSFLLFFVALRDLAFLGSRVLGFLAGAFQGGGPVGWAAGAVTGWAAGPSYLPLWLTSGYGSALILGLSLAAMVAGYREATRAPRITELDVPIEGLPPGLSGLRIAQISDLHIGATIRRAFVEKVVGAVNGLGPDLVALTGDIVDGPIDHLKPHFEPLTRLEAPLGRYYVTGNHEFYWDADGWIRAVRESGLTALVNTHAVVERAGHKIVVAGVLDYWATRNGSQAASDPVAAIAGAPKDAAFRLLLAHQPKTALAAASLGYDLQLSGHTHGGQFLPWTLVVRGIQPFVRGLHRVGRMWVYVNRGTGYWGPPMRLGAPSEITLIRLRTA
jgi:predicted MPP superfamily phosphohydrolase